MAKVKREEYVCDRCGYSSTISIYSDKKNWHTIEKDFSSSSTDEEYLICKTCMPVLVDWIKTSYRPVKIENNSQGPYR